MPVHTYVERAVGVVHSASNDLPITDKDTANGSLVGDQRMLSLVWKGQ